MARSRADDRGDHLGREGLVVAPLRIPGCGWSGRCRARNRARAPPAQGATTVMRLANLMRKIPRVLLFAVAGLIQVALVAAMVIDRVGVLREGKEVTLQTRPIDPRDLLRG